MIEPTDEMIMALWRELPSEAQEGREPDDIRPWVAAVLAVVERSLPRCPYVEWGFKVRLCSLPIGHNGSHDLKDRVLS